MKAPASRPSIANDKSGSRAFATPLSPTRWAICSGEYASKPKTDIIDSAFPELSAAPSDGYAYVYAVAKMREKRGPSHDMDQRDVTIARVGFLALGLTVLSARLSEEAEPV